jgi:DNA-binding beta-propeller fold protein YncE
MAAAFAAAMAVVGPVALGAPANAGAPPVVRDCIAGKQAPGCRTPPAGSLAGASSLAISPDGRSVYLSAYGANGLLAFGRDASGRLTFQGCVANDGAAGCVDPPKDSLAGTAGVAVSPGGGDVYVTSDLGRSITRFARARSGAISFGSCTANAGAHGCTDPRRDTLAGASAVTVGPRGRDVYVTSLDGAAVTHFRRAADGSLLLADCIADAGAFGCVKTPDNLLEGADALVLGPGGRELYVASLRSGSLARFTRAADGSLTYRDCIADAGANGCRKTPIASLLGATGLAISADGGHVFVASQVGVVASFDRSRTTGKLAFRSCIGQDGKGGCAEPRPASLGQATGIVTRGRDIYVASQGGDAITRLKADRQGRLAVTSCIAARRAHGCQAGPAASLDGVYALAVRGRDLYTAAPLTGALSSFALARP